jgi:hypothetical protein
VLVFKTFANSDMIVLASTQLGHGGHLAWAKARALAAILHTQLQLHTPTPARVLPLTRNRFCC